MAGFDDWADALLPVLPGASRTATKSSFLIAAKEFYKRTRAWRIAMPAISISEGVTDYVIDPVSGSARPVMIEEAYFNGAVLGIAHKPLRVLNNAPSKPLRAWMRDPRTVAIWPNPDMDYDDSLALVVSAYPTDPDALPDFADTHHFEGLESGTLARMYAQPGKPYSDPKLADLHMRKANVEVQRGKARVSHGNAGLGPVWSYGIVPPR